MKIPVLLLFVVLASTNSFGQNQSYKEAITLRGCSPGADSIEASRKGNSFYIQVNGEKKKTVGTYLTKDSALAPYKNIVTKELHQKCYASETDAPSDFIFFINSFYQKAVDALFTQPEAKKGSGQVTIADTLKLPESKTIYLLTTTKEKYEMSLFDKAAGAPKSLLTWDSATNQYLFTSTTLSDTDVQKNLPAILYLKDSVAGIRNPTLSMLYYDDNTYALLSIDSSGTATSLLPVRINGVIGDSIKQSGPLGKAKFNGVNINTLPIQSTLIKAKELADDLSKKSAVVDSAKKVAAADSAKAVAAKAAAAAEDTSFRSGITFLSAFNFDFSNKFSSSFLGLFNIFAPHAFRGKRKSWFNRNVGVNVGFEKVDYTTGSINGNDSSESEYFHQNILVHPLDLYRTYGDLNDTIRAGAAYYRQLNKYTFTFSNTVYSFYWQFLINSHWLTDEYDKKAGIYFHAHLELLINQYTKTANIQTIDQDTQMVAASQTHNTNGFTYSSVNQIVTNYNFISQYYGLGLTAYFRPFYQVKDTHIFAQLTLGAAQNTPDLTNLYNDAIPPNLNSTYNYSSTYTQFETFYLFRFKFIEQITKNSDLMIGFNLRGAFNPSTYPQYAAFIGINLGLSPIITAITGSSKSTTAEN